jgi:hypothetical protein
MCRDAAAGCFGNMAVDFFSQELPADERLMNLSLRLYEHHMMACPK